MTGNEEYLNKWQTRMDNLIKKNSDIKCLKGYSNYIMARSITTKYYYINHVIKFIRYCNKDISEISAEDYLNYLADLSDKVSSYQITVYTALKKLSKYLDFVGINKSNPMVEIESPKNIETIETETKRENNYLNADECNKYLDNVRKCNTGKTKKHEKDVPRDLAIIVLMLNTGMRCSALNRLDVESIDLENNTLITTEKERKVVEIPFSETTATIIKEWLIVREEILDGVKENALFISNRKKRLCNNAIANIVQKYAADIEGKHISPHKLRATYGTALYESTHDLYFVQHCMGHASPKTTEKYIRGQKGESKKRGSELMGKILAF